MPDSSQIQPGSKEHGTITARQSLALTLALSLLALFPLLGRGGLMEPDEGRVAGIAYEMYSSGDWITPRLYDESHFEKPPLIFWLVALAYRMGGIHEWTARLPAACSALGVVLLTWAMGRRLFGATAALYAALILLSAPLFIIMARVIDPNMLLSFWIVLALWSALAWQQDGQGGQRWIFYIALGLACLTKGPVGAVTVLLTLFGLRYCRTNELYRRRLWFWPGVLVAVAIGLWWFVVVSIQHPELWKFYFKDETYQRLFTSAHKRSEPLLYFFAVLPLGILPWLPSLLPALGRLLRKLRTDPASCFLGSWIILPVLMFSLSNSKLPAYVLPLIPALALLAGRHIEESGGLTRLAFRIQAAVMLAFAAAVPCAVILVGKYRHGWVDLLVPLDVLWLIPAGAAVWMLFRAGVWRRWVGACALLLCVYGFSQLMVARHDTQFGGQSTTRGVARALVPLLQPDDRVYLLEHRPSGLRFYLRRPVWLPRARLGPQVQSDDRDLAARWHAREVDLDNWANLDHRVYLIAPLPKLDTVQKRVQAPIREIYRDGKYVVVTNP